MCCLDPWVPVILLWDFYVIPTIWLQTVIEDKLLCIDVPKDVNLGSDHAGVWPGPELLLTWFVWTGSISLERFRSLCGGFQSSICEFSIVSSVNKCSFCVTCVLRDIIYLQFKFKDQTDVLSPTLFCIQIYCDASHYFHCINVLVSFDVEIQFNVWMAWNPLLLSSVFPWRQKPGDVSKIVSLMWLNARIRPVYYCAYACHTLPHE